MPAEVALALRGPGWTVPFTPNAPAVRWVTQDLDAVARSSVAASAQALRSLTAVTDAGLAPTLASDAWQRQPAAERFADLARAWLQLATSPLEEPAAAWSPQRGGGVRPLRRAILDLLAWHPQDAPGSPVEVAAAVRWQLPLLLGRACREDGEEEDGAEPEELSGAYGAGEEASVGEVALAVVQAVLDEAAWLGLTGAGALVDLGSCVVDSRSMRALGNGAFDELGFFQDLLHL
jgi:hypothetical protein